MINIAVKSKCTGCSACVQKCPKQCISFEEDSEGFYYPQVKLSLCINCGLCENVCPVLHQDKPRTPEIVYAAKNSNLSTRLVSSSGGIFALCMIFIYIKQKYNGKKNNKRNFHRERKQNP